MKSQHIYDNQSPKGNNNKMNQLALGLDLRFDLGFTNWQVLYYRQ